MKEFPHHHIHLVKKQSAGQDVSPIISFEYSILVGANLQHRGEQKKLKRFRAKLKWVCSISTGASQETRLPFIFAREL